MSGRVKILARLVVGGLLIALLLSRLNLPALKGLFLRLPPQYWLFGVLYVLAGIWLSCVKLGRLLRAFEIRVSQGRLFVIYLISTFWSNFLPSTIGGDVVKFTSLRRYAPRRTEVAVAIFTERLTGLLALLALALVGAVFYGGLIGNRLVAGLVVAGALGGMGTALGLRLLPPLAEARAAALRARFGRLFELFHKAHVAQSTVGRDNRAMAVAAATSALFVLVCVLFVYTFARGLGYVIPFGQMALVVALIQLVTMLPISINGLGVREWAYVYLLGRCGIPPEPAVAISLMTYLSVLAVSLIGGAVFALSRQAVPEHPQGQA